MISFKSIVTVLSAACLFSCVGSRVAVDDQWAVYEDWDLNRNDKIEESEFIECYLDNKFFQRWTGRSRDLSCEQLETTMFNSLDRNKDAELDSAEWNGLRANYYFGQQIPREWDLDNNSHISMLELKKNSDGIISEDFDPDSNSKISPLEMAQAMFDRIDDDKDGKIGALEFYHWLIYR